MNRVVQRAKAPTTLEIEMFKNVTRSSKIGSFDPAMLCRQNTPLVTVMPVLSAEFCLEIVKADDFDQKNFWERAYVPAIPAVIIVAALLGLYI